MVKVCECLLPALTCSLRNERSIVQKEMFNRLRYVSLFGSHFYPRLVHSKRGFRYEIYSYANSYLFLCLRNGCVESIENRRELFNKLPLVQVLFSHTVELLAHFLTLWSSQRTLHFKSLHCSQEHALSTGSTAIIATTFAVVIWSSTQLGV